MKNLKKFNEKWDYTPGKVADHELAEEIANDLLPRFQKMREEGKKVTVADFDKYMEERGATFELSDSVMNILVSNGFDFDVEEDEEADLPEPYLNESISDALLIAYLILFIKWRDLTPEKMMSNLKSWILPFSKFLSSYGYPIDTDVLEYKFDTLVKSAFDKIDKAGDFVHSKFRRNRL